MSGKTYLEAVREALIEEMESDDRVFIMGEDIAVYGGAFKVTEGMLEQFGEERVIDTPIAEAGMIGAAVGAALMDRRPIVEIQFLDFLSCGFDALTNFAAKCHYRWGASVPLVIRGPGGGGELVDRWDDRTGLVHRVVSAGQCANALGPAPTG